MIELWVCAPIFSSIVGILSDPRPAFAQADRLNPAIITAGLRILADALQTQTVLAWIRPKVQQMEFLVRDLGIEKIQSLTNFDFIQKSLVLPEIVGFRQIEH